jgi:hypothetical protein
LEVSRYITDPQEQLETLKLANQSAKHATSNTSNQEIKLADPLIIP